MKKVILYFKVLLLLINSLFFTLLALPLIIFPKRIKIAIGKLIIKSWATLSCKIFSIKVKVVADRKKIENGTLIASNHVSYLDIFVLGSIIPGVFLSKAEVIKIPIIGIGAWVLGVLFVDRSSISSGVKVIRKMARTLNKGVSVITFPEGTTTKIEKIRDFHRGTFQAAVMAKRPVQIIAINYKNFSSEGWAKEDLSSHFNRIAVGKKHKVYMVFGEKIEVKDLKPRELRDRAKELLEQSFEVAKKAKINDSGN